MIFNFLFTKWPDKAWNREILWPMKWQIRSVMSDDRALFWSLIFISSLLIIIQHFQPIKEYLCIVVTRINCGFSSQELTLSRSWKPSARIISANVTMRTLFLDSTRDFTVLAGSLQQHWQWQLPNPKTIF